MYYIPMYFIRHKFHRTLRFSVEFFDGMTNMLMVAVSRQIRDMPRCGDKPPFLNVHQRSSRLPVLCSPFDTTSKPCQKYSTCRRRPSRRMRSTPTDLVSYSPSFCARWNLTESDVIPAELVVSLNSNDAQIYTRKGAEWVHTVTLSEVRFLVPTRPHIAR